MSNKSQNKQAYDVAKEFGLSRGEQEALQRSLEKNAQGGGPPTTYQGIREIAQSIAAGEIKATDKVG